MTMTPESDATTRASPAGSDAEAVWAGVLRDYRTALADQRAVLDRAHAVDESDTAPPAQFVPPAALPPFPESLHAAAAVIDAETAELLAAARELLAGLKPPNAAPVHRSILAPPSPSQMDTRL